MNYPPITEGTLTSCYGRIYRTAKEAKEAFIAGKDFYWNHPSGGTYCSIRDYAPGDVAKIRYNKNQNITFVTVPG